MKLSAFFPSVFKNSQSSSYSKQEPTTSQGENREKSFLDPKSTPQVPYTQWFCKSYIHGAGAVIIQPSTGKVVLMYRSDLEFWFLPKGRKDRGESLEQTALREAYEESGYHAEYFPLAIPTLAPRPPPSQDNSRSTLTDDEWRQGFNTESFCTTIVPWQAWQGAPVPYVEYITSWFIARIGPDAKRGEGARTADEQAYETYLLTYDEAMNKLADRPERNVLKMAYDVWENTKKLQESV